MESRRLGYDATKSRGERCRRGIALLEGLCALLLLYLYHFVRSECFWIPSFLPILVLTLARKILASSPRWKGHLPADRFIVTFYDH